MIAIILQSCLFVRSSERWYCLVLRETYSCPQRSSVCDVTNKELEFPNRDVYSFSSLSLFIKIICKNKDNQ